MSVVGISETLSRELWASAFSKGDTENRIVGGGDRHTADAQKFSIGGKKRPVTDSRLLFGERISPQP